MKGFNIVGLGVLFLAAVVLGSACSKDSENSMHSKMEKDMKEDMAMSAKAADMKTPSGEVKIYKEIWECPMKDYTGPATKEDKCPVCGMKLTKKLVMRGLKKEEIGKDYVCPITGDKFKGSAMTKAAEYKGKTYYFCCNKCPDMFMANPDKYIKK